MSSLAQIKVGEMARIKNIETDSGMKRRLWDLGMTKGTLIEAVQASPSGDPIAYRVRGTIIAIRNCDAAKIQVVVKGVEMDD